MAPDLAHRLHRNLKQVDRHYKEATYTMAYNPLRVVPLAKGAFERYCWESRKDGNDGHYPNLFKLPHMNLSDSVASELLQARNRVRVFLV
jgi:hypothetical protein